jgi:hypothetical protein
MSKTKNSFQTLSKKEVTHIHMKVWIPFIIFAILFLLFTFILPHRAVVVICLLVSLAALVVGVILSFGNKKNFYYAFGFILIAFLFPVILLSFRCRYTFVNGITPSLLIVPTVAGLAVSILFTFAFRIHNEKLRPIGSFIGMTLLFAFLFAFGFCMIGAQLNYILDTNPPTPCEAIVEDKDVEYNSKSPDTYELIVTVDGKQRALTVSSNEYYSYDIGDTYTFYRYQGAFNILFYFEE